VRKSEVDERELRKEGEKDKPEEDPHHAGRETLVQSIRER